MKNLFALGTLIMMSLMSYAANENHGVDPTKKAFDKWSRSLVVDSNTEAISKHKEEGIIYVSFEIGIDGGTENVQIESGSSEVLNKRAIEIVKDMPKQHLYENGFIEGTRFVLPVKFSIR